MQAHCRSSRYRVLSERYQAPDTTWLAVGTGFFWCQHASRRHSFSNARLCDSFHIFSEPRWDGCCPDTRKISFTGTVHDSFVT